MRYSHLDHHFVQHIPERLEAGVLYISMEYGTAAHRCCCGCGEEVVTPFTPTDWKMTYDGETVSLRPSIGNWNLVCRSHYVIERGRIIEARPWGEERIAAERRMDKAAKARYYGTAEPAPSSSSDCPPARGPAADLWSRVRRWLSGRAD